MKYPPREYWPMTGGDQPFVYVGMKRVGPGSAKWHVYREKGAHNELRVSDEKLRELTGGAGNE